jgi:uncharacterized protein YkwD
LSPRESELRNELFAEVNNFRASIGRSGLKRHAGLDALAQQHSEYLRSHRGTFSLEGKNISHYGFEGRAAAAKSSMGMESLSENVIAGNQPGGLGARQMVAGWKGSPGHLNNMRGTWDFSGIGVAVDSDGHVFATQIFATNAINKSRWSGPQTTF